MNIWLIYGPLNYKYNLRLDLREWTRGAAPPHERKVGRYFQLWPAWCNVPTDRLQNASNRGGYRVSSKLSRAGEHNGHARDAMNAAPRLMWSSVWPHCNEAHWRSIHTFKLSLFNCCLWSFCKAWELSWWECCSINYAHRTPCLKQCCVGPTKSLKSPWICCLRRCEKPEMQCNAGTYSQWVSE